MEQKNRYDLVIGDRIIKGICLATQSCHHGSLHERTDDKTCKRMKMWGDSICGQCKCVKPTVYQLLVLRILYGKRILKEVHL
jgi:hypothetical protein